MAVLQEHLVVDHLGWHSHRTPRLHLQLLRLWRLRLRLLVGFPCPTAVPRYLVQPILVLLPHTQHTTLSLGTPLLALLLCKHYTSLVLGIPSLPPDLPVELLLRFNLLPHRHFRQPASRLVLLILDCLLHPTD